MNDDMNKGTMNQGYDGSASPQSAYAPPEANIHEGYAPPQRTAPQGNADGKLKIIIILLVCILAVEAALFATGFIRTNIMGPTLRQGQAVAPPNFSQDGTTQDGVPQQSDRDNIQSQ
jgi:hypothetical protein